MELSRAFFRKLAKIEGIEGGGSIRSLVVGLESHNLISNEILELTLDLAVLRNKVAHADEEVITYDVASAFRSSVERILSVIKQVD